MKRITNILSAMIKWHLLFLTALVRVHLFSPVSLILGTLFVCPWCAFVSVLLIGLVLLWCDFFAHCFAD